MSRPEESTGSFRTVRALQTDTARDKHFKWAQRWSTVAKELETLKDGAEAAITAPNALLEVERWVGQYAMLRGEQLQATQATPHVQLPTEQRWALSLPSETEMAALSKLKPAVAAMLARVRALVFANVPRIKAQRPVDPAAAVEHMEWCGEKATSALAHPMFTQP